jgi:hypothetical protein
MPPVIGVGAKEMFKQRRLLMNAQAEIDLRHGELVVIGE